MPDVPFSVAWCVALGVVFVLFVIIGKKTEKSSEPVKFIPFTTVQASELQNVTSYNYEVARIYYSCAINMLLTALAGVISRKFGAVILLMDFFPGVWFLFRRYKRILSKSMVDKI